MMIAGFQIFQFFHLRLQYFGSTASSFNSFKNGEAKRCQKVIVIVPCSGPLITHFWQFLGPNLEFNTFLHSDNCSVGETAYQMTPSAISENEE